MFLIVVTDMYIGSQCKASRIRRDHIVQNLKQCRFPCSVIAYDGYMFTSLNLEADILKKDLGSK